jgi:uncharacterized protein (TIGR00369 family)
MADPSDRSSAAAPPAADPPLQHGGFAELIGYRVAEWTPGRAAVALEVAERHLNRSGVLHGGVMSTLIDTACGYSGCYCPHPDRARRAMTLQLSTQFVAPVRLGARLSATATVTGGGRSVFFAACTVYDDAGTLVGHGEGVFRYIAGSGDPDGVPNA